LPNDVLPEAERLLSRFEVPAGALEELRQVLGLLALHDLPNVTIELAPGMARGIAYYSGLIFELYADSGPNNAAATPICGGGRYDGLALALTGTHSFPALGFSFAVEVLQAAASSTPVIGAEHAIILVRGQEQRRRAYHIADLVRSRDIAVTVHELTGCSDAPFQGTAEEFGATVLLALPEVEEAGLMPTVIVGSRRESTAAADALREACASVYSEYRAPVRAGDRA
jgi:histidyl-tRNA synthetase